MRSIGLTFDSARTMKFLQTVRKYFQLLGIHPPPDNRTSPFNSKNAFVLCTLVLGLTTASIFGISEAKSVTDYGLSFFSFATHLSLSIHFAAAVWRITSISKLIDDIEELIERSKFKFVNKNSKIIFVKENVNVPGSHISSKLIYKNVIDKIEAISAIYFGMMKFTVPAMMLPLITLTLVNYFIFDLKEESYILPFPLT